ncbi:MAG: NAD(+)/NADH kinase [Candidatus Altiarchaeota archaeon]|nr:NAD(+)/NADH kinase [Candidatus Altiarchaeota archaeon]
MQISRVGVISNPQLDPGKIKTVVDCLSSADVSLYFDPHTAEKINQKPTDAGSMDVDAAVLVGGDGTFLWAASKLKPDTLLLPINAGDVGYLSEISLDTVDEGIKKLLGGDFHVEKRMKLSVGERYEILNEAIISTTLPATLLEFNLILDGSETINLKSDGILVSTPTGSTAYSFSLGNPIIHPHTNAYIVAPISPLRRDQAAMVLPSKTVLTVELVQKGGDANLILDGQCREKLPAGTSLIFRESEHTADFVRFSGAFTHRYVNIWKRRGWNG